MVIIEQVPMYPYKIWTGIRAALLKKLTALAMTKFNYYWLSKINRILRFHVKQKKSTPLSLLRGSCRYEMLVTLFAWYL